MKFRYSANTFALEAGETFDYEYLSSYLVTFYINDTMAQTGPYYLRIIIIDEAEPCVFKYTTYHAEAYEANVGGGAMNPGYGVTDQDNPDTVTYSLLPATYRNLFNINSKSGEITFKVNYDVDASHPSNVTLVVKCEDSRGKTGTATVSLYIKDINDNIPEFPTGLVYYINQYTSPGAIIGTLRASDIDSGENADVEYYGSSSTGSAYFRINTNGQVILTTNQHITWPFGTTHTFTIIGRDQGSPRLQSTTTLDIVYINVTTTTASPTTQATDSDWWSDPGHIALVVFACLLALLLLAFLLFLLYKYCRKPGFCNRLRDLCRCNNCCKRKPPQPKVSKKPTPKSEPFKFWDGSK
ncbi:hypothetical protein KUTeg_000354 [Tegillarca granosa]|uniref:Cadherin domain-containing protein n=1 Tax=Tegillarca granosa TaxID=220873 RepID=A0ABQ9G1N2_TEGGR|nr:hypothetical protein KUTeg_000354 [Tegillarca granosa]